MGRAKLVKMANASSSTSSGSTSDPGQAVEQVTKKFEAVTLPPVVEQEPVRKVGTAGKKIIYFIIFNLSTRTELFMLYNLLLISIFYFSLSFFFFIVDTVNSIE